jgi:hypothetical protein
MSIGAIVIGTLGEKFYWANNVRVASVSNKRMPRWLGRALFIGVGVLLLIPEIIHFLSVGG